MSGPSQPAMNPVVARLATGPVASSSSPTTKKCSSSDLFSPAQPATSPSQASLKALGSDQTAESQQGGGKNPAGVAAAANVPNSPGQCDNSRMSKGKIYRQICWTVPIYLHKEHSWQQIWTKHRQALTECFVIPGPACHVLRVLSKVEEPRFIHAFLESKRTLAASPEVSDADARGECGIPTTRSKANPPKSCLCVGSGVPTSLPSGPENPGSSALPLSPTMKASDGASDREERIVIWELPRLGLRCVRSIA